MEYRDVIPEADREGVIRYVIGVGTVAPGPDASAEAFCSDTPSCGEQIPIKSRWATVPANPDVGVSVNYGHNDAASETPPAQRFKQ